MFTFPATFFVENVVTPAIDLSFLQGTGSGTNASIYTFSSQNLGTADAQRYIVVCIESGITATPSSTVTLNSVTVGGVTATIINQIMRTNAGDTAGSMSALAIAKVPTGTTGDIVCTFSNTMLRCLIQAYRVVGIHSTPYDSATSSANDPSFTAYVPDDGIIIACSQSSGTGRTATWTGVTEDYDSVTEIAGSSASDYYFTGEVGKALECAWTTNTRSTGNYVSFRPIDIEFSYLQAAANTADLSTYTFSSQNLGTAADTRYIIVCIQARKAGATTTISSVTVGGIAATIVAQQSTTATNTDVAGIAIAAVPTGTTGDVVVTFGAAMARCVIQLYRATDINPTAVDTGTSSASSPTTTLDIPAGGFAVGCGVVGASTTCTWSNLNEDYDAVTESFMTSTSASKAFSTLQSGLAVSTTFGTATEPAGVFASWGA